MLKFADQPVNEFQLNFIFNDFFPILQITLSAIKPVWMMEAVDFNLRFNRCGIA